MWNTFLQKTKLIHNCVQTDKLMHELRASRASKKLIETLERRDDKLKLLELGLSLSGDINSFWISGGVLLNY